MKAGAAIASGKRGTTVLKKFGESLFDGMDRAIRVVGCRIEATRKKREFYILLPAMRRYPRGHGAKSSKEIEKAEFLVIPGTESAYFRSERRNPIKTGQSDSETYPNRPSRIDWNQKFRDPFVLWGATCQKSGF